MLRQLAGEARTAHFDQTHHEVMKSFEPGDTWGWCYVHERMLDHFPRALISLQRCAYRSMTTSSTDCAQQVSRVPIAGNSSGSGW